MMNKRRGNDYFVMMKELVECSLEAAKKLNGIIQAFSADTLEENLVTLHEIEHRGDMKKHALVEKLAKEFITPIDREDIMDITSQIDDVTDAVEDVLLKISMFNIQTIPDTAKAFADVITQCVSALLSVFTELSDFKKSKTIHASLVEINRLEEDGDALYIRAVRKLYENGADAIEATTWTELYGCLERCCDTCEHTADMVENVVMKNT